MTDCMQTKKSNCKNCYKCIRHCPVKSIGFTNGQAHIIQDECVLCGECFVICPQNAKQIRNDIDYARSLINEGNAFVSLAPSFIARYKDKTISDMENALLKLGFSGVSETAIGATVVKKQYENLIKKSENHLLISSCCHTVNTLIQKHFVNALPYLANVVTPMQVHSQMLKEEYPNCKVVFIGPCISKKAEADKYKQVDCVLTFDELDLWLESEGIVIKSSFKDTTKGRTRLFPTCGGIIGSMDKEADFHYIAIDGMDNCINILKDIESSGLENCFIEMSACKGSCVAGPIMKAKNPIKDLLSISKSAGGTDFTVAMPPLNILRQDFGFEGVSYMMPGSAAIDDILKKMGKETKAQELNCGSCGYNTCREKAVAVYMGKADLSMCLPFLKDRAESFSDTIIHNTPNGIIVIDEELHIQQINNSAKRILNLPLSTDIIDSPVVRILDPLDYVMVLDKGTNVFDNRKYLAEYQKYIKETIIYDKEYHIIIIILKDVSHEEELKNAKEVQSKAAIEITDKVIEKQMRIVQEIASLLGETTAETKIALTKLKETLSDE